MAGAAILEAAAIDGMISADGTQDDLRGCCELLELSGLLDEAVYRAAAGISDETSSAEHYLREGWRRGLEPGPNFEGGFLRPYFEFVGLHGAPALTYLTLFETVRDGLTTRSDAENVAHAIRDSALFDATDYAARAGTMDLDPALHYVIVGEMMGLAPSRHFDPVYYRRRYLDLPGRPMNALGHYLSHGRTEGRRALPVAAGLRYDTSKIDPARGTVLLLIHEATRTGAPILGYNIAKLLGRTYNVVAVLLADGELANDFRECCAAVIGPLSVADAHPVEAEYLVSYLLDAYRFTYAVANSIDTRILLRSLTLSAVPVVSLVHEFSSYVPPRGEMGRALEWSTEIVFSSEITRSAALADYPNLDNRPIHILRQGLPDLPPRPKSDMLNERRAITEAIRPEHAKDAFVVLGCGTVTFRKGVDTFLACASAVAALKPRRAVRFVWIGTGTHYDMDRVYRVFLEEQIERAGLKDLVTFVDPLADLDLAYRLSDLFLLSSRLDPLPNVGIEAALHGRPVICFENATGFAEILRADPITRPCVVPYLDTQAAAREIARLADDGPSYQALSQATLRLANAAFDMDGYARRLDEIGRHAAAQMRQRQLDFETISSDPMFDMEMSIGSEPGIETRGDAIEFYLARTAAFGTGRRPTSNFYFRRPCPGFHPQVYAHENRACDDLAGVNPLAHFIRAGKPAGPWRHDVIKPSDYAAPAADRGLRVALHGHFHYPELIGDFLSKLAVNHMHCDLLLSTTDDIKKNSAARGGERLRGRKSSHPSRS